MEDIIAEYNGNGKKTLLFVCDNSYPVVDGVWRVLTNCAEILQRDYADFNVLILAPDYKGNVYVDSVPILGCKSAFSNSLRYQCSLPLFDCRMKRWLKRLKIDLIHVHSPFLCGMYAKKLHKSRHIPMVATFHSQYRKDIYKATHSKVLTRAVLKTIMRVFNSADEVWTMHTASRAVLYEYGYKGKSRLMPNATPLKPLKNYDAVRQSFRDERHLQGKTVFVFVGRIITQKGVLFLADVLAKLRDDGIDFKMYFVGDGPDLKQLKSKISSLNLSDRVDFVGEILGTENLAAYYVGADLFLFPSLYDVSSIVQIEAATYKTPTVFAEGSVTSCTVTDGVNGFILPYDEEKYARGVADIIRGGKIDKAAQNALNDLHVEWEEVVQDSAKIYNELIEQAHSIALSTVK